MGTLERPLDRGTRLGRSALIRIGAELRESRAGRGLSLAAVAAAAGISESTLSRIELGQAPGTSYLALARCAAIVGLDLSLRAFPGGHPLRDKAQLGLIRALRTEVAPSLVWATEVPLRIPGDQRAWDATISGIGWSIPVEAETAPRDIQAVARRLHLKLRDSGLDAVLLLVQDTRRNRTLLRDAEAELRELFPFPGREALGALRAGNRPEGSAFILLRLPPDGRERRVPASTARPTDGGGPSSPKRRRSLPRNGRDRREAAEHGPAEGQTGT